MFFPKIFFTLKWFPKSEIHGSCVVQFQITNMYLVQIHCVWKKKKRIQCSELSKFVDVILKIAFQRKFTCSLGTCHSRSAQNDSEFCHLNCRQEIDFVFGRASEQNAFPVIWTNSQARAVRKRDCVNSYRNLWSS